MAMWSTKRRFVYGGSFLFVVLVGVVILAWNLLYQAPTCTDGVKNGTEAGIDCGGSCVNLCSNDALSPTVIWAKVFPISGDVYSVTALVENPNINSKNAKATYDFRLFDEDNRPILVESGSTSIPKNKRFAIFKTGIIVRHTVPKFAEFRFTAFSPWQKDTSVEPEVNVTYGSVETAETAPKVRGTVTNRSIKDIKDIELVVLVMDADENVIGTSRTYVTNLFRGETQDFVFTWQKPFERPVSVVNVIHRIP
ncbi:MAG: FxLYD domain-containing protein [Patescibacteria group bacterium]